MLLSWAYFIGVNIGPIISGNIAAHISWRWFFWVCTIFQGVRPLTNLPTFQTLTPKPGLLDNDAIHVPRNTLHPSPLFRPHIPNLRSRNTFLHLRQKRPHKHNHPNHQTRNRQPKPNITPKTINRPRLLRPFPPHRPSLQSPILTNPHPALGRFSPPLPRLPRSHPNIHFPHHFLGNYVLWILN